MSQRIHRKHVEQAISHCDDAISLHEKLERLRKNKDFKAVIEDGYLVKEAIRTVNALGDPNIKGDLRASIQRQAEGVGCLNSFFNTLEALSMQARVNKTENTFVLEKMDGADSIDQSEIDLTELLDKDE